MQLRALSNAEREERFGRFSFRDAPTKGNPERIIIDPHWVAQNIMTRESGLLCAPLHVRFHRLAILPFIDLRKAWLEARVAGAVHTWNGSFVPRYKRGRAGKGRAALSNHSWGTAFDINAREYPLGKKVPASAPVRELVAIANELGWFWGGDFKSRPDGMHFEYVGV